MTPDEVSAVSRAVVDKTEREVSRPQLIPGTATAAMVTADHALPTVAVRVSGELPGHSVDAVVVSGSVVTDQALMVMFIDNVAYTWGSQSSLSFCAKADVYFLADRTGSMSSQLGSVRTSATEILTALQGMSDDVAFGVGSYKDFPFDSPVFQHQLNPTTSVDDAAAQIAGWTSGGGGDTPEAAFYVFDQLAQPAGGSIGWRPNSARVIVWFGDAPAHDPVCAAISGLDYDITEASVTAKLVAENIAVLAIDTNDLDGDPSGAWESYDYDGICDPLGGTPGQATRIAAATGGEYTYVDDLDTLVDTVLAMLTERMDCEPLAPTGWTITTGKSGSLNVSGFSEEYVFDSSSTMSKINFTVAIEGSCTFTLHGYKNGVEFGSWETQTSSAEWVVNESFFSGNTLYFELFTICDGVASNFSMVAAMIATHGSVVLAWNDDQV